MPGAESADDNVTVEKKFRAFIAVPLSDRIHQELKSLVKALQQKPNPEIKKLRWPASKNYHLTLAFLGDIPESAITPLQAGLQSNLADQTRFSINMTEIAPFPARRPHVLAILFAESEQLQQLHQQITATLDEIGIKTERRKLLPHLTLARSRNQNNRMKSVTPVPLNLKLPVDSVTLYRSTLASEGVQHDVVFEIPLVGEATDKLQD